MKLFVLVSFVALIPSVLSMNGFPAICTWDPPISVEAGASLSARIDNPWAGRCTATLRFADSEFLPINWSFDAIQCADFELAQLSVPVDLPNGDAQCAGQAALTCSHVEITNGRGNISAVSLDQSGTVGLTAATTSFQTTTTDAAVAGAQTLTAAVLPTGPAQTGPTPAPAGAATTQPLDAPPSPPTTVGAQNSDVGGTAATTPTLAGNEVTSVAPPAGTPLASAAAAGTMSTVPPNDTDGLSVTSLSGLAETDRPLPTSTATLTVTDCMVPCSTTIAPA
ncbi:hypothetical protein CKAH01_17171 [Colletotrichum kahawae]|uniref:Uncharacterized protein n=1 Tax=Colletotrichum kahawae TaxID=34407 RepID=A0AAE0D5M2_COLKA|nr:hypothetical protein CKAH01_17171 [Colletotrichum kahawae]